MRAGKLISPLRSDTVIDVAVKVLKDNVLNKSTRDSFEHEVKTISSFDHDNILHLIGVVVIGMPLHKLTSSRYFVHF